MAVITNEQLDELKRLISETSGSEDRLDTFREALRTGFLDVDVSFVVGASGEELDFVVYGAFFNESDANKYVLERKNPGDYYNVETTTVERLERTSKISYRNEDGMERGAFMEMDREDVYGGLWRSLSGIRN
jgi:hypothetical protein|tara:strand:- start:490 stop:885 length:396 start_codon:yes stop_codon:yes gene_type:complete